MMKWWEYIFCNWLFLRFFFCNWSLRGFFCWKFLVLLFCVEKWMLCWWSIFVCRSILRKFWWLFVILLILICCVSGLGSLFKWVLCWVVIFGWLIWLMKWIISGFVIFCRDKSWIVIVCWKNVLEVISVISGSFGVRILCL